MPNIYLEDNPPVRKQWSYPRKEEVSGAIVIHTAQNMTDLVLPDTGAEGVANFIRNRSDAGSYLEVFDSDSYLQLGKYEWQMYHEGTGGNRFSLGYSFACRAEQWKELPDWWVDGAMFIAASRIAKGIEWVKETRGIIVPLKRITRNEYFDRKPGFISHAELDPGRRSDPGEDFPWAYLFSLLQDKHYVSPASDTLPSKVDRIADRLWNLEAIAFITWAHQFHLDVTPDREVISYYLDRAKEVGLSAVRWEIASE